MHRITFTRSEIDFLSRLPRGHLATVGPDGVPQVKPVGFTFNEELGTIDIAGFNMAGSAKYRNVRRNPKAAFVVDEVTANSMEGAHFVEIRGVAELTVEPRRPEGYLGGDTIRIHPRRILSCNVDPDRPGVYARDVPTASVEVI